MEVLKAKLKEDEHVDHEEPVAQDLDEEETLMKELNELREFVNNNKECIEEYFHIERTSGGLKKIEEDDEGSEISEEETDGQREAKKIIGQIKASEEEAENRI